jgi:hypothetical protein
MAAGRVHAGEKARDWNTRTHRKKKKKDKKKIRKRKKSS